MFSKPKRIYLDYASITPIDDRVISVIGETYKKYPANPSSLYTEGVQAQEKLEESRSIVAKLLEVHGDEIYFTSGGTEGDNLALVGPIKAFMKQHKGVKPHVVSSVIEHPAVLKILEHLSDMGVCDVSLVPVEEDGRVSPKSIKEALRPETVLVSVMYVNNEIGTVQPIAEIAKTLRHFKKDQGRSVLSYPYLHTDACQAAQYVSLRVPELGIDLMTLDGSKIYGPRGCGAVYIKRGVPVESLLYGGDQEKGIRPGTEPLAHIVGFAKALQLCREEYVNGEIERVKDLRNILSSYIKTELQKQNITITENGVQVSKVPNNINFCIEGIDAEFAVLKLDACGIATSSVTSCRSKKDDSTSYVVEALETAKGIVRTNTERVVGEFVGCGRSSLRITLGRYTTLKEIKIAQKTIVEVLTKIVGYTRNK